MHKRDSEDRKDRSMELLTPPCRAREEEYDREQREQYPRDAEIEGAGDQSQCGRANERCPTPTSVSGRTKWSPPHTALRP